MDAMNSLSSQRPECAARVMKVEGCIYKGYRTKDEAWDAYRAALAEGRVKVVRSDNPPGPYGTVPTGAQAPPPSNPSSAPSPARTPRQAPRAHAPEASSSRPQDRPRTVPPSPNAHAHTATRTPPNAAPPSVQSPGQAPVSRASSSPNVLRREPEHAPSPRRRTQSSAPSPAGEPRRSPRRPTSVRPKNEPTTSKFKPSRSPVPEATPLRASTSNAPYAKTERSGTNTTTSSPATGVTCIEPDLPSPSPSPSPSRTRPASRATVEHASSHRSASRAGSAANWSPLTNVTYIEPDEPDLNFSCPASTPSARHRDAGSTSHVSRRTASRTPTVSLSSSPTTNVTHTVPDIVGLNISAHGTPRSRPSTRTHSHARPASQASQSTRHRMREGVEYRNVGVQATPPQPARSAGPSTPTSVSSSRANSVHHGPSVPPSRLSSPARGVPPSAATSAASSPARSTRTDISARVSAIARSQSESAADMRYHLLSSRSSLWSSSTPSPSPHPGPSHLSPAPSASTARRAARPRDVRSPAGTPAQMDAPLSPLNLGLSQPLHTPGVVYPAASDPRSPIQRSTSVPSSAPVFHRPSPPDISFSSMLLNP
ncbi:hypothetical protein FOMPIDRAFT_95549 [Fomitopsis schrenkii]|uniref:Uncharacterized protein n=1 Tax=Fomitopsis schrenkii TaxID=2126942 RepID=S8FTD6_FOMSC|nr:hypothetical protein FOMPIDRAFT_95549 [Fomitopsis schrenkii]